MFWDFETRGNLYSTSSAGFLKSVSKGLDWVEVFYIFLNLSTCLTTMVAVIVRIVATKGDEQPIDAEARPIFRCNKRTYAKVLIYPVLVPLFEEMLDNVVILTHILRYPLPFSAARHSAGSSIHLLNVLYALLSTVPPDYPIRAIERLCVCLEP